MIGVKKAAEELNVNCETLGHWVRLETNPLSCNQCGYKVAQISKLKKHEKTHLADDERENEEDNFVGNENIKKREIISEKPELKERTYDLGINTKCADFFDPHELISTDPAPNHKSPKKAIFTCSHCGLTYKRKDSLEDHMKAKHRDGIMLQCSPCEKEFASKNALKKHIESKHEGKRYKCQHCTHEATQQINLKTHIRKKHNLDIMMSECPK